MTLDFPVDGTLAPLGARYYQIAADAAGELTVTLQAVGFAARVSLVDASGNPLVQSDGAPAGAGAGAPLVDVNVPAGSDYLEVQSLGGSGTYQLTAKLALTDAPFETVPSLFSVASQLAEGDFNGDQIADLVAPDGIHLGTGDGTFLSNVIDGPLGKPGWTVTAVVTGIFNRDHLEDIAFTEISPNGCAANLCVLQDVGGGQFTQTACLPVEPLNDSPEPSTIAMVDFGGGLVDLAIADQSAGAVAIFVGDGNGGFAPGPILTGLDQPVGLASGQFGDGYIDLIVADQGDPDDGDSGGLTVFQTHGQEEFVPSGSIDVGSGPSAVVAGDFNGDGVLDLAVAESNSDDVSVLLNNGNGTFQAPQSYAVGSTPLAIVACDFGNGHIDLATANSNSNDVSILLGNGDGTFQPQLRFVAGAYPESLVAYDLNGDGRPDLAVGDLGSGDDSGDITVLLGRGDGTFQDQAKNLVGNGPMDAVTADLNNDGHLDVITTNFHSNDVSVLMGNGDGTFQAAQSFAAGVNPTALVVGDFNGDGLLDLAVADRGNNNGAGAGVAILLGDGDGTFQPPAFYATGAEPAAIVAGYFTGDDILDLAVANHGSNNVSILLGKGDGGFVTLPPVSLGNEASGPISITSGDFGNGQVDLAVANQATDNVSILLGNGGGDFVALTPIPLGTDMESNPSSIVEGDFSGDNSADLAVASTGTDGQDSVTIMIGLGQGRFAVLAPIDLGIDQTPTSITTGHFFGGNQLDLAIADSISDQVSLLKGDGDGEFGPPSVLSLGTGGAPLSIAAGDFNGDKETDLAVALQDPNSVTIELNQGNGQFTQPGSAGLVPRNTPIISDFTGDGVPDVAIVDGAGDVLFRQGVPNEPGTFEPPITINPNFPSRDIAAVVTNQGVLLASVDATDNFVRWFTYRNGHFRLMGILATGLEPAQIVAADLGGGGGDDLIIRNAGDSTLTIYMSSPLTGGFLPPITLAVGPGISDVSVSDINQDGRPDILLANQPAGEVEMILDLGDGSFSQPTFYRAGVGLSAVVSGAGTTPLSVFSQEGTVGVAAAFNPGGPPDIIALDAGSDTLGILTGLGDGRFANAQSLATTGPTLAVGIADFNGDGNPDLATLGSDGLTIWLGNGKGGFVSSTTYNVGPDPTGLTIADVSGDKVADLVVGNAFGDVLVLLGEGNGVFQSATITDQHVALAVNKPKGSGSPTFVYSDQANDRVVVKLKRHRTDSGCSGTGRAACSCLKACPYWPT